MKRQQAGDVRSETQNGAAATTSPSLLTLFPLKLQLDPSLPTLSFFIHFYVQPLLQKRFLTEAPFKLIPFPFLVTVELVIKPNSVPVVECLILFIKITDRKNSRQVASLRIHRVRLNASFIPSTIALSIMPQKRVLCPVELLCCHLLWERIPPSITWE